MKVILLDIEGTTTPIDLIHRRLFPYSRERMADFVKANFADLSEEVAALSYEFEADAEYVKDYDHADPRSVAEYLVHLIDRDRKSTPLKAIQGRIWQAGYENGDIVSEMYADVEPAFRRWTENGIRLAIYSSGSKLAQKLIFEYSSSGDLSRYISAYFDTTTGPKRHADSYQKIAAALEMPPNAVTFFSDIPEELAAATDAGLDAILVVRPGNAPVGSEFPFRRVASFDEI